MNVKPVLGTLSMFLPEMDWRVAPGNKTMVYAHGSSPHLCIELSAENNVIVMTVMAVLKGHTYQSPPMQHIHDVVRTIEETTAFLKSVTG